MPALKCSVSKSRHKCPIECAVFGHTRETADSSRAVAYLEFRERGEGLGGCHLTYGEEKISTSLIQ